MSNSDGIPSHQHVALLPSAGMGHLTPFLRLAALLVHNHCRVTLISTDQTVSLAESQLISRFLSAFPQVDQKYFHILPLDPSTVTSANPFWLQWEAIRRSSHLLSSILSSLSPPLSALIFDVSLISSVLPVTKNLCLPNYVFFTSSARMFSVFASFPSIVAPSIDADSFRQSDVIELPGLSSIPKSSIPPLLFNPDSYFRSIFSEDSRQIPNLDGILINTFEELEASVHALNGGKVIDGWPPLFAVGPLVPSEFEKGEKGAPIQWLDDHPAQSVVYVSFGSRTPLSREQIREVGDGLVRSGCKFLWVVKDKMVDKDDEEGLAAVLGHDLAGRIKDKGLVVKDWVDQGEILGHRAVGGFVSHCGWNSVVEASWHGVPLLAWPQHGDQKINAEVVETSGLGMWVKSWGWGEDVLVKGEEIGERIQELMVSDGLRLKATQVREEARKAVGDGGSSNKMLRTLIQTWNKIHGST